MAHPNDELIERFYAAFNAKDGATMAACYAPDARFHDPVFGDLTGEQAGAMWRMLTGRAEGPHASSSPSTAPTTPAARPTGSPTTHSRRPSARSSTTSRRRSGSATA